MSATTATAYRVASSVPDKDAIVREREQTPRHDRSFDVGSLAGDVTIRH